MSRRGCCRGLAQSSDDGIRRRTVVSSAVTPAGLCRWWRPSMLQHRLGGASSTIRNSLRPARGRTRHRHGHGQAVFASGLDVAYAVAVATGVGSSYLVANMNSQDNYSPGLDSVQEESGGATQLQQVGLAVSRSVSMVPLLNWMAWVAQGAWKPSNRYYVYGAIYALPLLLGLAECLFAPGSDLVSASSTHVLLIVALGSLSCPVHFRIEMDLQRRILVDGQPEAQLENQTIQSEEPTRIKDSNAELESVLADVARENRASEEAARACWDRRMELRTMTVKELRLLAKQRQIRGRSTMRKAQLIDAVEASEGLLVQDRPFTCGAERC